MAATGLGFSAQRPERLRIAAGGKNHDSGKRRRQSAGVFFQPLPPLQGERFVLLLMDTVNAISTLNVGPTQKWPVY